LTGWKQEEELDFLNNVSDVPLQQGLRHLQKAFGNFWAGRAEYPNYCPLFGAETSQQELAHLP
jgi:putative transposase